MARPPALWRWQEHQELCAGGKRRMDITPRGWAVPPGNLWQVGEALPALQTLPQLLQLSAELSAALLSLLPGFGVLSGLWHLRAASPKTPVWGSPKPCAV